MPVVMLGAAAEVGVLPGDYGRFSDVRRKEQTPLVA
jgi:hypothetical protein